MPVAKNAYQRGYRAGLRKRKPTDVSHNPFKHLSESWIKWNAGWNAAWHRKQEDISDYLVTVHNLYGHPSIELQRHWQCDDPIEAIRDERMVSWGDD